MLSTASSTGTPGILPPRLPSSRIAEYSSSSRHARRMRSFPGSTRPTPQRRSLSAPGAMSTILVAGRRVCGCPSVASLLESIGCWPAKAINYFLVDAHALELADPRPVFGIHAPIICPSGVAAFARDPESSAQVWSAEVGYPGDPRYREFYRDVGHDLDSGTIARFLLPDGARRNVGLKYHRVTGRDVPLRRQGAVSPCLGA